MANITLLGASYTDVPAVTLPQTGGGTVTFYENGGGTPSATQHTIYFEFSDSTDATITAYWDDSFISDAITATTPTTYGSKTVTLAQLDNVTWYERPSETWETLYDSNASYYQDSENDYPYFWITSLNSVTITVGSVWRVTCDSVEYRCTAISDNNTATIGNPKWGNGTDSGTNEPFCFTNQGWGAWTGSINKPNADGSIPLKIERLVTT